jgi:hypothetical protein
MSFVNARDRGTLWEELWSVGARLPSAQIVSLFNNVMEREIEETRRGSK